MFVLMMASSVSLGLTWGHFHMSPNMLLNPFIFYFFLFFESFYFLFFFFLSTSTL